MTSRDRVLASMSFRPPDRVAAFDEFWPAFTDAWRREKNLPPSADIDDHYGIDIAIEVADECFYPGCRGVVKQEDDYQLVDDGWGRLTRQRPGAHFFETVDNIFKDKGKLDELEFEPPELDSRYDTFVERVRHQKTRRCTFAKIGGIFRRSCFARGEENLLMDMALDKPFVKTLFARVADHLGRVAVESLTRGDLWDTGLWIFDDMGSKKSTMFSPDAFEEFLLPLYTELIDRLRKAGINKVVFHSDGNIVPVLDHLVSAGFNGINPVEPNAGMNILELRDTYAHKLALIGGIDNIDILPSGDHQRIAGHVVPVVKAAREGGIVIGMHSVGPDISVEAYDFYHKLVEKHGT